MREVYRSLRIDQVEGAATLLREAGIEVSIQNGRSYKSRRRNFSFRDRLDSDKAAILYVTHNSDLPEARKLLRGAGLMDPGQRDSFLSADLQFREPASPRSWFTPQRLRTLILLLLMASIAAFVFFAPTPGA
jgi:hypothetical protein